MTKTKEKEVPQEALLTEPKELNEKEQKEVRIIERVIENREITPVDAFGKLTRSQVELMKRTVAKGSSDDELKLFLQVCKGAQLNPFLKQVFLVPRWDTREGKEVRAIQVSIDGFRSIAESSGQYAGNDDPAFEGEKDIEFGDKEKKKATVPLKATVSVYKAIDGQRYPFTATARWDEYYPGPRNGFQWHIRPYLMLGKCAEALALRKAFPKLLSGMYEQAELERSPEENEADKVEKGFTKLMSMINTMTAPELDDWIKKIDNSDKYTVAQKHQFVRDAKARLETLK